MIFSATKAHLLHSLDFFMQFRQRLPQRPFQCFCKWYNMIFMKNFFLKTIFVFVAGNLVIFASQAQCPTSVGKEWMLGKVGNPSKFFTPIKDDCDSETLNVFTNCIEASSGGQLYFGHITRSEAADSAQCPFGYSPQVANGLFSYQRYDNQKVCLDPCHSISVGKTFRDDQKFGERRALNIGDVVYVPELKGRTCGTQKHDGCAIVSQFIEYTNDPVLDFYAGTCKNIARGRCLDYKDESLPSQVSLYKLDPKQAETYRKAHSFPKVSTDSLELVRTPAASKIR